MKLPLIFMETEKVINSPNCTNIVYYPYREQVKGSGRSVPGLMEPSARKYAKGHQVIFSEVFSIPRNILQLH